MYSDLAQALRERQLVLRQERDALAHEMGTLQTRQFSVAGELTRIDSLLELYEPGYGQPEGEGGRADADGQLPLNAALTHSGSAVGGNDELPMAVAPPPEGAWKAEALRLLEEHGAPMHYKELYRVLATHGFTFGGRNPEAVLLTGVSREKETFVAMGKGCYWITGLKVPSGASQSVPSAGRRVRRPRPIGRLPRRVS